MKSWPRTRRGPGRGPRAPRPRTPRPSDRPPPPADAVFNILVIPIIITIIIMFIIISISIIIIIISSSSSSSSCSSSSSQADHLHREPQVLGAGAVFRQQRDFPGPVVVREEAERGRGDAVHALRRHEEVRLRDPRGRREGRRRAGPEAVALQNLGCLDS